jgi:DNA-binding Lrp family transcriptional regulator
MSAEQKPGVKPGDTLPVAPESPARKFTLEEIEERIAGRAKQYQKRVEALERSQFVTGETMRLQFDAPGECGPGHTAPVESETVPVPVKKRKRISEALIERMLAKRAKEIQAEVRKIEESQKVTKETLDLEFTV